MKALLLSLESHFSRRAFVVEKTGAVSVSRKGLGDWSRRGPRTRQTSNRVLQEPGRSAVSSVSRIGTGSPNQKAPGPPEVRLEREGAKGKARRGYYQANAMSRIGRA